MHTEKLIIAALTAWGPGVVFYAMVLVVDMSARKVYRTRGRKFRTIAVAVATVSVLSVLVAVGAFVTGLYLMSAINLIKIT